MPLYRKFLDQQQYSSKSILRYERVFGAGFVSTGGADTTKDLLQLLQLQPGEKVLDVGCGIGGEWHCTLKTHLVKQCSAVLCLSWMPYVISVIPLCCLLGTGFNGA